MLTRGLPSLVAIVMFVTSLASQTVKYDPARAAEMHDNLRGVNAILAAVTRGDLDAVRAPARELAVVPVPAGLPEGAERHMHAMRLAGEQAATAADVATAATAAARMLVECGACHRNMGTMPAVAARSLPAVGGTVGHMLEHQRAVDRLVRGLVIPSNTEWAEGARALRAAPLHAKEPPRDVVLAPELLRVEEAVHRVADEAAASVTPENRMRMFSTLLVRCSDCHRLHRKIWGPGGAE